MDDLKATAKNGDVWQGERSGAYWLYCDSKGNFYDSKEVPAYRIDWTGCTQRVCANGKLAVAPL